MACLLICHSSQSSLCFPLPKCKKTGQKILEYIFQTNRTYDFMLIFKMILAYILTSFLMVIITMIRHANKAKSKMKRMCKEKTNISNIAKSALMVPTRLKTSINKVKSSNKFVLYQKVETRFKCSISKQSDLINMICPGRDRKI